jgi:hypothetical protein
LNIEIPDVFWLVAIFSLAGRQALRGRWRATTDDDEHYVYAIAL